MKKIIFLLLLAISFFFTISETSFGAGSVNGSFPLGDVSITCPSDGFFALYGGSSSLDFIQFFQCSGETAHMGDYFFSDYTTGAFVVISPLDINTFDWDLHFNSMANRANSEVFYLSYVAPPPPPPSNYCAAIPSCANIVNGCSTFYGSPTIPDTPWINDPTFSSPCSYSCANGSTANNCISIPDPTPITGYFSTPVSVASGSYNWSITLNLSASGHINDISTIQIWDAFMVDSATTNENTIVLALSPAISPLSVECGTYTLTIPSSLIQGNDGVSANPDPITGSFSVTGCPSIPPTYTGSTSTGMYEEYDTGSKIPLVFNDGKGNYFVSEDGALRLFLGIFLGFLAVVSLIFVAKTAFKNGRS